MPVYDDWHEARAEAQRRANAAQLDVGIRKVREYGRTRFVVSYLPRADRRYGDDLRCEVVTPEALTNRV